ncbi:MAG: HAMP domain-containing histidine kinase [Candidatus Lindowbacteria bacterium]|nr:HAMP domain-containing histidine kinase [Candidatus Lindowbacteria bacterium]
MAEVLTQKWKHDLRTPINVAEGYIQLLLNGLGGDLQPQQQFYIEGIKVSCYIMKILLKNFCVLNQIEEEEFKLDEKSGQLSEVFSRVASELERAFQAKNAHIFIEANGAHYHNGMDLCEKTVANLLIIAMNTVKSNSNLLIKAECTQGEIRIVLTGEQVTGCEFGGALELVGKYADLLDGRFEITPGQLLVAYPEEKFN